MYFTIVFMKGYDPAVFHMIVTHFERGPFLGLNARTPKFMCQLASVYIQGIVDALR